MYQDSILSQDVLAEQWHALLQDVIGQLQSHYRRSGLTQKEIAVRLGKRSPEVVSRCLSGQRNMTLRTMHELARAMDCRLEVNVRSLRDVTPSNRAAMLNAERDRPVAGAPTATANGPFVKTWNL